ncbi:hypothetical protein GIW70_00610 [Pseudomonas syringae]|nr:hypothetical protein [Pseudomonas syringae]MCF5066698.1 hypothetical protein [Pseudomonas syringae]
MLVPPVKNTPARSLIAPEIPDRTRPLLPSGEWGINRAAAHTLNPEYGMQVYIAEWAKMGKGDAVRLLFDGRQVDQHTIAEDSEVNERVTLYVAPRHLLTGSHTLTYAVEKDKQAEEVFEPPVRLYVKIEIPGGQDTDPEPGQHSELYMFIPPEIVNSIVDMDIAEEGVPIIIRARSGTGAPYPDAAVGDIIKLSWGGEFVDSSPLTAEQIDDPANHPIIIRVEKDTILKAGDTDGIGLAVSFKIRDLVHNESEDWCKATRIRVSTGIAVLSAPIVDETQNNILNLDTLGDKDITVHVTATSPLFKEHDVINVTIRGTTQAGEVVEYHGPATAVSNIPHTFDIPMKNADIRTLAKTQATVAYTLTRDGSADASNALTSKGQFIQIIGESTRLAAPIATHADQGAIDPDLVTTYIRIPHDPMIKHGMAINHKWRGTRPNGSRYEPDLTWYIPDKNEVEHEEGFLIPVEGKHLKTIEGGTLDLSYDLLSEGEDPDEPVRRSSRPASQLRVGEPQFELIHPIVESVIDGALDPDELPNGTGLIAPRPTVDISKRGDIVTYTWVGDVTGTTEDSVTLSSLTENKDVRFNLNAEFVENHIKPNRGQSVTAKYRILRADTDKTSFSNPLTFIIGQKELPQLKPAKVLEAPDGILNPADVPNGATVEIEANDPDNAGDHFYMVWTTTDGATVYEADKVITGNNKGLPVKFTVDQSVVQASKDKTVIISYHVVLFEGGEAQGEDYELQVQEQTVTLPLATFAQATGPQKDQLNPDDVYPDGAIVLIPATARLKTDDEITVTVEGQATTTYAHKVSAAEEDKELSSIKVPHSVIDANDGGSIALTYTVKRAAGGTDGPSNPSVYDVRKVVGSGTLKVMGARYNRSTYRASSAIRMLSAFNATTGQPLQAQWKYPAETDWKTATTWRDVHPHEPLQVRTNDDQLTLNPANIFGNGIDTTVTGLAAFVAHRDVGDVVGWGNAQYGALIPSTIITMDDIVEVSCTRSAYAARRANGAVVVWGTAAEGGSMTGIDPLNFVHVVGNATAFTGLKTTGRIVAWGTAADGGTIPAPVSELTDIVHITAAGQAFAAQRATGHVVAWGLEGNGGTIPADVAGLTDIETLIGSFGAFAAHRANGRIVGWGHATHGGNVPAEIAALTDIIELSCANAQAFAARRATGQVVAWGTAEYGGTIDPLIEGLTDIVEVSSNWRAFAARRANGRVVAWGRPAEGGAVPDDIATLNDIVQVCGSSMAFAALRRNGTVVAWGNATVGGDTTEVVDQLTQVQALYDNTHGFTALTADGRVVTWGNAAGGGDSSAVQDRLRGKVSYLANPASRGLALKASRLAYRA